MATYTCDEGDGPAYVMITFVETGDVSALCVGHFEAHARAFVEQMEQQREQAAAAGPVEPEADDGGTFPETAPQTPQEPPAGEGGQAASDEG